MEGVRMEGVRMEEGDGCGLIRRLGDGPDLEIQTMSGTY